MNVTSIPAPRVPFIDERTGLMSREWYRFLLNLFTLTGSGTSDTSITDLAVSPASQVYEQTNGELSPAAIPYDFQIDPLSYCAPAAVGQPITLTGDVSGSGISSITTTLASIISAGGPTGSATVAPIITYDDKGRLTAVSSATITPAIGSVTGLGSNVATWLATPSSANLAAALTDELGSGKALFGATSTFTPSDASGAGLAFTSASGKALTVGNVVMYSFQLAYPATASGAGALIGGFATAAANTGPDNVPGVLITNGATAADLVFNQNATNLTPVIKATGVQFTNAQLSGLFLRGSGFYYTS